MIKKEVFKGLVVGIVANVIGLYLATLILGNGDEFVMVLKSASAEGFLGKLISLGSILNLAAFFVFIKKRQDYRARGVLLATVLVALITFIFKFM